MAKSGSTLRKSSLGLGVILLAALLAMVILPLVVPVDSYRPRIEHLVNERLNGQLKLGKLSLSLWGQISVRVEGIQLDDAQGRKLLSARDVSLHVPLFSVFGGAPLLTLRLGQPEVTVVKDKSGKLNVLALMKSAPASPTAVVTSVPSAPESASRLSQLVRRARLGLELDHAHLAYRDEGTALEASLRDLNLSIRDLSLSRPTEFALETALDTTAAGGLVVRGPARVSGKATPRLADGAFQESLLALSGDFDRLEIRYGDLFEKKSGIAARLDGALRITLDEAHIERLNLKFHNAELAVLGGIGEMRSPQGPLLDFQFKSNAVGLKPWNELIPPLAQFDLGGSALVDGEAKGRAGALTYRADLALKGVTAKSPDLAAQPQLDGEVHVSTDRVESLNLFLHAPGNDLRVTGKVASFRAPRVDLVVQSTGMDLDELIAFKPIPRPSNSRPTAVSPVPATPVVPSALPAARPAPPPVDYDAMLAPLRGSRIAARTVANLRFGFGSIKAHGVKLTDLAGQLSLRDLSLSVEALRFGLFGGKVSGTSLVRLSTKVPAYRMHLDVSGLQLQQAVASQLSLFKDTLLGEAAFRCDANGMSFNPDEAKASLQAKGNLAVRHASFATIDIARIAAEALRKALGELASKVPQAKDLTAAPTGTKDSRYELVSSDFTIEDGKFHAPNFQAKAEPNRGIDVKGDTRVALKDYALSATWTLVDTYNWTRARDLSLDLGGGAGKIEHLLASGAGPVEFPIRIGGTLFAPQVDYSSVPEAIVRVAVSNLSHGAGTAARAELRRQAEEQIKKLKTSPEVKSALQDLGKKLFGP